MKLILRILLLYCFCLFLSEEEASCSGYYTWILLKEDIQCNIFYSDVL